MPIGIVKWFDCKKGFGFIVDPDGQDVFVHFSEIEGSGFRKVRPGQTVEYELAHRSKGLSATKVRHLEPVAVEPVSIGSTQLAHSEGEG